MYPAVGCCKTIYASLVNRRVKRSLTICFCMFLLMLAGGAFQQVRAGVGEPRSTMSAGEWDNTIALTIFGGFLYTIEKSGGLYRTDPGSGKWVQIGKPEFANTAFMFSDALNLYTIETDGSLYRVIPANGAWNRLGEAGGWKDTMAVATWNNSLFSIEKDGALYRTDLGTGRWAQVGKAEFGDTRFLFSSGPNLYTIERDGSLYRVNPANGAWSAVGVSGTWRNTIVGTMLNGQIYTVEGHGGLYETNPATGVWKQIGKAEFGKTQFLFGQAGSLYTIEAGDLYRINPTNGAWVAVGK